MDATHLVGLDWPGVRRRGLVSQCGSKVCSPVAQRIVVGISSVCQRSNGPACLPIGRPCIRLTVCAQVAKERHVGGPSVWMLCVVLEGCVTRCVGALSGTNAEDSRFIEMYVHNAVYGTNADTVDTPSVMATTHGHSSFFRPVLQRPSVNAWLCCLNSSSCR